MCVVEDKTLYTMRYAQIFETVIHSFSTIRTYVVQNLLKINFFRAQSQYWQWPSPGGKDFSKNKVD
jgi:hypothetical protein